MSTTGYPVALPYSLGVRIDGGAEVEGTCQVTVSGSSR